MAYKVIDQSTFLLSLAAALVATSNPPAAVLGSSLFVLEAAESRAAEPYAVLQYYAGPTPNDLRPRDRFAVQCMVTSRTAGPGLTLSRKLYETLYHADIQGNKRPRNSWMIPALKMGTGGTLVEDTEVSGGTGNGYEIVFLKPSQQPYPMGRNETTGKYLTVFNFEVQVQINV